MSFSDLPGVVTAATSPDDARIMAEETLALQIESVIEDGKAIPEPSSLERIMADVDNRSGVAVLIAATVDQPKAVRVNVTLPEDALAGKKTIRQIRFLFHFFGNHVYLSPSCFRRRGVSRPSRDVGGGMRWAQGIAAWPMAARTNGSLRTAKSCGPDTPTLVSRGGVLEAPRRAWWPTSPAHQGDHV